MIISGFATILIEKEQEEKYLKLTNIDTKNATDHQLYHGIIDTILSKCKEHYPDRNILITKIELRKEKTGINK